MSTETAEDTSVVADLGADIPCDGINIQRAVGVKDWVDDYEPCDRPAAYRWTVRHCGVRSGFSCEDHYAQELTSNKPNSCRKCRTVPIHVTWKKL